MTEEIITFETAKLAKEINFDIIQNYDEISSLYNEEGNHVYYHNYGFMYSGLEDNYISAPTQSLLQKWLREELNMLVYVENSGGFWNWVVEHKNGYMEGKSLNEDVEITFEQQLETGLQVALKYLLNIENNIDMINKNNKK